MATAANREVRVLDGSSFFISDALGDAAGTATQGFFYRDTRFLSVATLRVNGEIPALMSTDPIDYFSAMFFLTMPFCTVDEAHPLTIIRNRFVGQGVHEDVFLANYADAPIEVTLTLSFDCDFADLLEIKEGLAPKGLPAVSVDEVANRLVFAYRVADIHRQTIISFSEQAVLDGKTATFVVTVPAKGEWQTCIWISPVWDLQPARPKYGCGAFGRAEPEGCKTLSEWRAMMPDLSSDGETLAKTFGQSVVDLAALRFYPDEVSHAVLAAGLPWYMALFGRDNLIAAYQCCYAVPYLASCALRTLARFQGTKLDDFRDEEPGKIPHERRFGELTVLGESPHSPYYGTVDATPLFLVLLHELYRWTGDQGLMDELRGPAFKALAWIDEYGDADGDGYVEYQTRSPKGLDNHCWKDSWNSILFRDGTLAKSPIAVAEVQGYVYDAKLRLADLAEQVWHEPALATTLRQQAATLKERFNRDFWIPDRGGYFALALDRDKRQVDSMTSNMGHLLWSGIVDADKAERVVRQLMGDHLHSGWGVRTMSSLDVGFNPIDYHNGTVWPHDNSLIAAGLARYGYRDEANRIILGMLDAARHFAYRLPEVFSGYQRTSINFPVDYPTASSPQAWATGAPMLFVRTMLGLEPETKQRRISTDPHLPSRLGFIRLENLQLFGQRLIVDSRGRDSQVLSA